MPSHSWHINWYVRAKLGDLELFFRERAQTFHTKRIVYDHFIIVYTSWQIDICWKCKIIHTQSLFCGLIVLSMYTGDASSRLESRVSGKVNNLNRRDFQICTSLATINTLKKLFGQLQKDRHPWTLPPDKRLSIESSSKRVVKAVKLDLVRNDQSEKPVIVTHNNGRQKRQEITRLSSDIVQGNVLFVVVRVLLVFAYPHELRV